MRNRTSLPTAGKLLFFTLIAVSLLVLLPLQDASADTYSDARQKLQRALRKGDTKAIRQNALVMLKSKEKRAVNEIVGYLKKIKHHKLYYTLLSAFGDVKSWDAIETILKKVKGSSTPRKFKYDLFWSLQLNASQYVDDVMMDFLKVKDKEFKALAILEVANRRLKKAIPVLIDIFSKNGKNSELGLRANRALKAITDKGFDSPSRWSGWWKKNKGSFEVPENTGRSRMARRIRGTRKKAHETVTGQDKKGIVVLKGLYDKIENALRMLQIPHTVVDRSEFRKMDLKSTYALLINCGAGLTTGEEVTGKTRGGKQTTNPEILADPFSSRELQKIKRFVARGGYLFTSDWGLYSVTERIFHSYISYPDLGSKNQSNIFDRYGGPTDKMFTRIWPMRGANAHNLLKDVFINTKYVDVSKKGKKDGTLAGKAGGNVEKTLLNFKWHMDERTRLIKINSKAVVPLIYSPELARAHKGFGLVAVTFLYGGPANNPKLIKNGIIDDTPKCKGGRVLHILGHLEKQRDPKKDGFALQKLLINFLIEGLARQK